MCGGEAIGGVCLCSFLVPLAFFLFSDNLVQMSGKDGRDGIMPQFFAFVQSRRPRGVVLRVYTPRLQGSARVTFSKVVLMLVASTIAQFLGPAYIVRSCS